MIDEIIIDVFNQPIEKQPLGIADMGCGDGMFLIHLYNLIKEKTLRGKEINKYPLVLVGADLNNQALESARDNLKLNAIDCNKSYTSILYKMEYFPVFTTFDIFTDYDNHELEDYTMYVVQVEKKSTLTNIYFGSNVSRCFGYKLKQIKN